MKKILETDPQLTKSDPRWILLLFFSLYLIYILNSPHFGRSLGQAFIAIFSSIVFDLSYNYIKYKTVRFPLSSILATMGLLFLGYSTEYWPFVLLSFLTVYSKFIFKFNGKHIYNPNNFALAVCFFLISPTVTINSGRWNNSLHLLIIFTVFGLYIANRVERLPLCFSYIITFILGSIGLAYITDTSLKIHLAPMLSSVFYLFTFFHITDPKTSPHSKKGMIFFGVAIGVVQFILRVQEIRFSGFYALFIVCSLIPLLTRETIKNKTLAGS